MHGWESSVRIAPLVVEKVEEVEEVEAVEELKEVEKMEGVVEEVEEVEAVEANERSGRNGGRGQPRTNQEKGSYDNAKTPISAIPASAPRHLALSLSKPRDKAEGDRQGDRLQPVANFAHPLLARLPTGIRHAHTRGRQ